MDHAPDTVLDAWLRAPDGETLSLDRTAAALLHAELQRLRQGNDRLRKQNKKLRGRIARLKAGGADLEQDVETEAAAD